MTDPAGAARDHGYTGGLLNLHFAIQSLALSGGGVFFAAYLLHTGVPTPVVLAALALVNMGRFAVRPLLLGPAIRFGLKPMVVAGTILSGLRYPLLPDVHGVGWPLLGVCVLSVLGETTYWTAYNAYFAALGDTASRGSQVGARQAVAAIVSIGAPLLGGWTLATLGPRVAFYGASSIALAAAAPLLWTRNVAVVKTAESAMRLSNPGVLLFAADGWMRGSSAIWQIALFLSLGSTFTSYGGAIALAAVVGALTGLILGRFLDTGHGPRILWLVAGSLAIVTTARAFSYGRPTWALAANAAGAIAAAIYTPTLMTAVYNLAKTSSCPMRFHMATEGGWDLGAASVCLIAAGVLWAGAPFSVALLLALFGAGGVWILLRRYYVGMAVEASPAALEI
jgi:DHA1 family inner membrane transport protein